MSEMTTYHIEEESVRGFIVGDVTSPYEFWRREKIHPHLNDMVNRKIASGHFANDEEAITWLKENHPEDFAAGCEMRVFEE